MAPNATSNQGIQFEQSEKLCKTLVISRIVEYREMKVMEGVSKCKSVPILADQGARPEDISYIFLHSGYRWRECDRS